MRQDLTRNLMKVSTQCGMMKRGVTGVVTEKERILRQRRGGQER